MFEHCVCDAVAFPSVHWYRNDVFIATSSDKLFHTVKHICSHKPVSLQTNSHLYRVNIFRLFFSTFLHQPTFVFFHLSISSTCVPPTAHFQSLSSLSVLLLSSFPSNWCWHQINNFPLFFALLYVCDSLLRWHWWDTWCVLFQREKERREANENRKAERLRGKGGNGKQEN